MSRARSSCSVKSGRSKVWVCRDGRNQSRRRGPTSEGQDKRSIGLVGIALAPARAQPHHIHLPYAQAMLRHNCLVSLPLTSAVIVYGWINTLHFTDASASRKPNLTQYSRVSRPMFPHSVSPSLTPSTSLHLPRAASIYCLICCRATKIPAQSAAYTCFLLRVAHSRLRHQHWHSQPRSLFKATALRWKRLWKCKPS